MPLHSASVWYRLFAAVCTKPATGMCASVSSGFQMVGLVPFYYLLLVSLLCEYKTVSGVMVLFPWKLEFCADHFVHTEHCDHSVVILALATKHTWAHEHDAFVPSMKTA